jgi:hypothetical protein
MQAKDARHLNTEIPKPAYFVISRGIITPVEIRPGILAQLFLIPDEPILSPRAETMSQEPEIQSAGQTRHRECVRSPVAFASVHRPDEPPHCGCRKALCVGSNARGAEEMCGARSRQV